MTVPTPDSNGHVRVLLAFFHSEKEGVLDAETIEGIADVRASSNSGGGVSDGRHSLRVLVRSKEAREFGLESWGRASLPMWSFV